MARVTIEIDALKHPSHSSSPNKYELQWLSTNQLMIKFTKVDENEEVYTEYIQYLTVKDSQELIKFLNQTNPS